MTFRPPLVGPVPPRLGPAPYDPPSLLEGVLANAGLKPFLQSDWPLARIAPYPVDNRTWIQSYDWGNLGKDKFFGPPGKAPTYDWPLPRSAVYPNQNRNFTFAQQLAPVRLPF